MDEPVPIRRAAVGCLFIALAGVAFALIVRPAIFTFAPERGDASVVIATAAEVQGGPVERDVVLTRSYGWVGETERDGGTVQLRVVAVPIRFGGVAVVAGTSPGPGGCPVQVTDARFTDCTGRTWTLEGAPIDPPDAPALQRFPAQVASGSVTVDFTRTLAPTP